MSPLFVMVMIFGVMGFSTNLFFRVIWLYCELQEGNDINWGMQALLTFGVPAAWIFVMLECLISTGLVFVP